MDKIEESIATDDCVDKEVDPLLISDNENLDPSVSGVPTVPVTAVVSAAPGSSGIFSDLCSMSIVFPKRKFLILANFPCLYFFLSCNLCRMFFFSFPRCCSYGDRYFGRRAYA
jgi:hypothetical protein